MLDKVLYIRKACWNLLICIFLVAGCAGIPQPSPAPTAVVETRTPLSTSTMLPTATPTATIQPVSSPITGRDSATFLKETYPDYSVLAPGDTFVKTWDIKNNGETTWNSSYSLALYSKPQGNDLGSPAEIYFPQNTPPGETVTLSVDLTAPATFGVYSVYWSLKNDRGETFGVDGGRVWVTILVCASGEPCSPPTAGGSTSANGISVTLTSFTYDEQSATVVFCMTMPNRNYALDYAPTLLVDQKPAPFLEGGSGSPWNCLQLIYQVSAAEIEQASQITLDINASLRMSPPQGDPDAACETARQNLVVQNPGLDFQCHFNMAGYYTDLKLPSGMTREQADQIIKDAIEGAIYGPWVLTIKE